MTDKPLAGFARAALQCYRVDMTSKDKEHEIQRIGAPWDRTADMMRHSCDAHINLLDKETLGEDIKEEWRAYFERHYEQLLDLILALAKRQRLS